MRWVKGLASRLSYAVMAVSVSWVYVWTANHDMLEYWPAIAMSVGLVIYALFTVWSLTDEFKERDQRVRERDQHAKDTGCNTSSGVMSSASLPSHRLVSTRCGVHRSLASGQTDARCLVFSGSGHSRPGISRLHPPNSYERKIWTRNGGKTGHLSVISV